MIFFTELLIFGLIASSCLCSDNCFYDGLYGTGVNAYYDSKWKETINSMQQALSHYQHSSKIRQVCRDECKSLKSSVLPDYAEDKQLQFLHLVNQHAVCRSTCTVNHDRQCHSSAINYDIHQSMIKGDVHNYIQVSLYKEGHLREARAHAATNCYLNPKSSVAKSNCDYYQSIEKLAKEEISSLEKHAYRDLYIEGEHMYHLNSYEAMNEKFESSLLEFYSELAKCRAQCEDPMQLHANLFSEAISSSYISVVKCRQACPNQLGEFREHNESNFFGSYFHFLQYGYFMTGRLQKGVKALTTHLRIEPNNEVAKMNRAYYQQQQQISNKDFIERQDAKPILDDLEKEKTLLQMLLNLSIDQTDAELKQEEMNDFKLLEQDFTMFPIEQPNVNSEKFVVVESSNKVTERIVIDNLLTKQQCYDLLQLTQNCIEGDGYSVKSPHTTNEKFEGLTILSAAQAAVRKEANLTQVQAYINASKLALRVMQQQFLQQQLLFSFTHLVCRTAKNEFHSQRDDLSHPVHADNCLLNEEVGECYKVPPAYTWRDYSAILYLNDDFQGGEFFFAHSTKDLTPQHYVRPQCGRLVGFSAGKENLHGVKAVTKGRRCAVALWFTLDPEYQETAFDDAEALLRPV